VNSGCSFERSSAPIFLALHRRVRQSCRHQQANKALPRKEKRTARQVPIA